MDWGWLEWLAACSYSSGAGSLSVLTPAVSMSDLLATSLLHFTEPCVSYGKVSIDESMTEFVHCGDDDHTAVPQGHTAYHAMLTESLAQSLWLSVFGSYRHTNSYTGMPPQEHHCFIMKSGRPASASFFSHQRVLPRLQSPKTPTDTTTLGASSEFGTKARWCLT